MSKEPTMYVCKNKACTLGTVHQLGRFTAGMTAHAKHLLTGAPPESLKEGVDYGDGICPNCGAKGEPYDPAKATATALAEAKAQYEAQVAALKEGVM